MRYAQFCRPWILGCWNADHMENHSRRPPTSSSQLESGHRLRKRGILIRICNLSCQPANQRSLSPGLSGSRSGCYRAPAGNIVAGAVEGIYPGIRRRFCFCRELSSFGSWWKRLWFGSIVLSPAPISLSEIEQQRGDTIHYSGFDPVFLIVQSKEQPVIC